MNESLLTPACARVALPLRNRDGRALATMVVSRLAGSRAAALVDASGDPAPEPSVEPIRVVEGGEYRYRIESADEHAFAVAGDLFSPDDNDHRTGRFKPGLRTGRLIVSIDCDGERLDAPAIEVLSTKLDYLTHYRWMMTAIASLGTGLVLERFATSETRIRVDPTSDATCLYQRFCFLKGLLLDGVFDALRLIVASPAVRFAEEEAQRPVSRGARAASSTLARDLSRAGPRVGWLHPSINSLPHTLPHRRSEPTTDIPANRFVRFAVEGWVGLLTEIEERLSEEKSSSPVDRGRVEVAALRGDLDEILHHEVLRDAGRLRAVPLTDQVLLKQAGYREVYRAWLLTEVGASLYWLGGDDVFGAGQKNVAALYEYWVFLELCKIVGAACGLAESFFIESIVKPASNGWALDLSRGGLMSREARVARNGRDLVVRLAFNRTFKNDDAERSSWTRKMRPDCTLEIEVLDPSPAVPLVRVHFDAKYKLDRVEQLIDADEEDLDDPPKARPTARAEDLLKMHAYRDAVVHAAGAYVIFPGDPAAREYGYSKWGEILPGLGAIPLRPTSTGDAEGAARMRDLVSRLLDHVSSQSSRHERVRFWEARSTTTRLLQASKRDATRGLLTPPADVRALFGFVRTREQLAWMRENHRYNLRADDRRGSVAGFESELRVDLVVLYGEGLDPDIEIRRVVGAPELVTADRLYAGARGRMYLLLPLQSAGAIGRPAWLDRMLVDRLRTHLDQHEAGLPFICDWQTVTQLAE